MFKCVWSDIAPMMCSDMIDGVQNVGNDDNGCMLTSDQYSDTMLTLASSDGQIMEISSQPIIHTLTHQTIANCGVLESENRANVQKCPQDPQLSGWCKVFHDKWVW